MRLIPLRLFGNLDLSFTNSSLFLVFAVLVIITLTAYNMKTIIPNRWQSVVEIVCEMMYNTVKDSAGSEGAKYFGFILSLFLFIATLNLCGLIPYTFSPTSHFAVAFGLSASIFIGAVLIGIIHSKFDYISMFMPAGAPLGLGPFLVLIELISHFTKPLSLGLRLAANITAGHLLFAILASFVWNMLKIGGLVSLGALFPFAVCLFIGLLELAVAMIQAYVFCLLTTIYLSESLHLH